MATIAATAGIRAPEALSPFFAAQLLWDATMAASVAAAHDALDTRAGKVFHLAGRFHVDYRQGTVAQLGARERRVDSATIIVVEVDDLKSVDWAAHADRADFLIVHE